MQVTIHSTGSRLRRGDVFLHDGAEAVVIRVNECRARCMPLARRQVEIKVAQGDSVHFSAPSKAFDISPNSEVEIVRRMGKDELNANASRKELGE